MQSQQEINNSSTHPNSSMDSSISTKQQISISKSLDTSLEALTKSNFYSQDSKSWSEILQESKVDLIKHLEGLSYYKATALQAQTIPFLLSKEKFSLIAQGANGSGKTLAYVIPCLETADSSVSVQQEQASTPQIIILTINTFLSRQIRLVFDSLSKLYEKVIVSDNERPGHIMIGTPGEINRLHDKNLIDFSKVKLVVLDEVDSLLVEDDHAQRLNLLITKKFPNNISLASFTAFFQKDSLEKLQEHLKLLQFDNKKEILLKNEELFPTQVLHFAHKDEGDQEERAKFVDKILNGLGVKGQVLIFDNLKSSIQVVSSQLMDKDWTVAKLPGNLRDEERNEIIEEFLIKEKQILVTSNLLAKGFDYRDVELVINMDAPKIAWDTNNAADVGSYLNRVGRGCRMGRKGLVINLYKNEEEQARLRESAKFFGIEIEDVEEMKDEEFVELIGKKFGC